MPIDVPDWSSHEQSFKRPLYPDGVVGVAPPTPSQTIASGATATVRYTLPDGTVSIRLAGNEGIQAFTYRLLVLGHQSGDQYFGDPANPGSALTVTSPTLPFTIPVDREWDSQVDVTVVNNGPAALSLFVSALFQAEAPGQAGASQAVNVVSGRIGVQVYDWQVDGAFTAAGTPNVNLGAGSALIVDYLAASLLIVGGGAAATPQLQLLDGVTVVKRGWYPVQAVPGQAPPFEVTGLGLTVAGAATWRWDRAIGANQFATLDMAGYFAP